MRKIFLFLQVDGVQLILISFINFPVRSSCCGEGTGQSSNKKNKKKRNKMWFPIQRSLQFLSGREMRYGHKPLCKIHGEMYERGHERHTDEVLLKDRGWRSHICLEGIRERFIVVFKAFLQFTLSFVSF